MQENLHNQPAPSETPETDVMQRRHADKLLSAWDSLVEYRDFARSLERRLREAEAIIKDAPTHEDLDAAVFEANLLRQRAEAAERGREGMVMVPRALTDEMLAKALAVSGKISVDTIRRQWRAALSASPQSGEGG